MCIRHHSTTTNLVSARPQFHRERVVTVADPAPISDFFLLPGAQHGLLVLKTGFVRLLSLERDDFARSMEDSTHENGVPPLSGPIPVGAVLASAHLTISRVDAFTLKAFYDESGTVIVVGIMLTPYVVYLDQLGLSDTLRLTAKQAQPSPLYDSTSYSQ